MAKCRYGDIESAEEEVPCIYDTNSGGFRCPQPHRRTQRQGQRLEMEIKFVEESGKESSTTLVTKCADDVSEPLSMVSASLSVGGPDHVAANRDLGSVNTDSAMNSDEGGAHEEKQLTFLLKPLSATLADITGEFIGTFFLTLVICTVVASSVVTGAQTGLWQVAIVCGVGVAISIYCTSHISDAHLNPAVTLAFAIVRWRVFSWKKVVPYIIAQLLGGICAGGVVYGFYQHAIRKYEEDHAVVRGEEGSEITAMMFGEYFPNPALFNHSLLGDNNVVSVVEALLIEAWGTGILVFVIFCFTDKQNTTVGGGRNKVVVPIMIGLTVSVLISLYAPLTQAGWNPARDFGPRIFAAFAGWWKIAIPGPRNGFWIYIVGPLLGGPIAAAVYDILVARAVRFARNYKKKTPSAGPRFLASNPIAIDKRPSIS